MLVSDFSRYGRHVCLLPDGDDDTRLRVARHYASAPPPVAKRMTLISAATRVADTASRVAKVDVDYSSFHSPVYTRGSFMRASHAC